MPVNFMPTGTDYLRILPEIIMTVAGALIMLLEGLLGDNKKRNLSALTFVAFAAALVSAVAANGNPGPVVFEHADRGRLRNVLPRAGDRGWHPESVFRHAISQA